MKPFLGQHNNRLDAKGRVSVPALYRSDLKEAAGSLGLVLRPSLAHRCIEAWPALQFNELEKSLQALDVLGEEYEDAATAIYADAFPVEPDKEGRILLPEFLVNYAGLTDAVTFLGRGKIFQIWEPAAAVARTVEAREQTKLRKRAAPVGVAARVEVAGA